MNQPHRAASLGAAEAWNGRFPGVVGLLPPGVPEVRHFPVDLNAKPGGSHRLDRDLPRVP